MQINKPRTNWTRFICGRPRLFLYSLNGRILLIYLHIFIFNIYHVFRKIYKKKYGIVIKDEQRSSLLSWLRRGQQANIAQQKERASLEWQWRNLPKLPIIFFLYRVLNTIYFFYVLLKNLAPRTLVYLIKKTNPTKPMHCYLLGRFVIYEQVRDVCAACFACFHLVWRAFTIFDYQPLAITTFYFLMLDDRDIIQYYKLLNGQTQCIRARETSAKSSSRRAKSSSRVVPARVASAQDEPSESHLEMMHDIMSYRIDHKSGTIFKLRPNRTAEACLDLRDFVIAVTLIAGAVFLIVAILITVTLCIVVFDDRTYLKQYANCDDELEQMRRDGRISLDRWSLTMTNHQKLATLFDTFENVFLWLESGTVLFSCIVCTLLLNHDLTTYWNNIHRKIELVLLQTKMHALNSGLYDHGVDLSGAYLLRHNAHKDAIYELQMEIRDFFKHLRRSDQLVGDVMTTVICVWFTLFAYFIYSTIARNGRLPVALNLVLLCVFFVTTALSFLTISVHRNCLRSYGKICSLMAVDTSRHKQHFTEILDFFVRRRTCYTIYRSYEMTTTTYMSIIGYSFSCFFILGSVNRKQ